jgi:hypothetical protein
VRNNLTISYDINIICFNTSCEMEKNKKNGRCRAAESWPPEDLS